MGQLICLLSPLILWVQLSESLGINVEPDLDREFWGDPVSLCVMGKCGWNCKQMNKNGSWSSGSANGFLQWSDLGNFSSLAIGLTIFPTKLVGWGPQPPPSRLVWQHRQWPGGAPAAGPVASLSLKGGWVADSIVGATSGGHLPQLT